VGILREASAEINDSFDRNSRTVAQTARHDHGGWWEVSTNRSADRLDCVGNDHAPEENAPGNHARGILKEQAANQQGKCKESRKVTEKFVHTRMLLAKPKKKWAVRDSNSLQNPRRNRLFATQAAQIPAHSAHGMTTLTRARRGSPDPAARWNTILTWTWPLSFKPGPDCRQ
jgi:hypothetical protein